MSEDLLAYFVLKNGNLSRDDKRSILLSNQSNYFLSGIEQSLRVSCYDIHEREKNLAKEWRGQGPPRRRGKGGGRRSYAHMAEVESSDADTVEQDEDMNDDGGHDFAVEADSENDEQSVSDAGASNDDDIFNAYATYKESRQKLKEIQRNRG